MKTLSSIVLLLCICLSKGDVCNVTPPEEDIDWKRIEGKVWYQVLNTGDPESEAASCHMIRFLQSDKDTINFNIMLLDDSNPERVDVIRQQNVKSGKFYTLNKAYETSWMEISMRHAKKKNPKLVGPIVKETEGRYTYSIALYTDYETYFIATRCTPEHHYVFAYATTPHLTPPIALSIFNTLVKSNNVVKLELASCKDIENIQSYSKIDF